MTRGQWDPEVGAKMDAAADAAFQTLKAELAKMTPEERKGAAKCADWWRDNMMLAGYKRLFRIFVDNV